MTYRLEFSKRALKDLKSMDPSVAWLLFSWLKKNVDGSVNPRLHGKALSGDKAGQWLCRIGDYRAICIIEDDRVVVLVLTVGHRRCVYDR